MVNNKIYIESCTDLIAIWNRHKFQLNSGLHPNKHLQREWTEFGQKNFTFEILSEIKQDDKKTTDHYRKEAKQFEAMFIDELKPFGDKGYNTEKQK